MTVSPLLETLAPRFPLDQDGDLPAALVDALCDARQQLAATPPATLEDAQRMAHELAAMIADGVAVDGSDLAMARTLASGLRRLAHRDAGV